MTNNSSKPLALVISAIKDLRERRGSTSHGILNYISSFCNIPKDIVKPQVLTALKRGTLHGILRETDGHYTLPTDRSSDSYEIATQELGLLDLSCRKRKQQQRKRNVHDCGASMKKKSRKRSRKRSKSRKMKGCGGSSGRKRKSRRSKKKRKSRSKYNCDKYSKPKSKKRMDCGTKKRSRSRRRKKRGKKSRPCTCPPKNTNKCTMNFLE